MHYLTTGEAARICGVGINTIKRWIDSGDLAAVVTPGGHKRIPQAAFVHFLKAHAMPVPSELGQLRMLIIDDDIEMCAFVRAAMEHASLDLDIHDAHDGYTGLLKIGLIRPHVLVLDIMLPHINGLEIIQRLRGVADLPADMRILVITGSQNRALVRRRLAQADVDAVLFKPVAAEALTAAVERLLHTAAAKVHGGGL